MSYRQDWLMRQISEIIQVIMSILFGRNSPLYSIADENKLLATDLLFNRLNELLEQKKINEAENLLFSEAQERDEKTLLLALTFYNNVNKFSDEDLEAANYSREEVRDGLKEVLKLLNHSELLFYFE